MKKQQMLAMILAGGRGSRLEALTKKLAKPAVHYGGKYRIIDFPLSNCANSNISIVGVLTQYESVFLNSYAAAGARWGLDARDSGVFVLPPREKDEEAFGAYRGTADAISQNIDFIDSQNPEYVLILSGDHIYKMDYAKMLHFHKEKHADATIAVLPVSLQEASRFGIMETDDTQKIIAFEEKPKQPRSNLASMGIYIFQWKMLRKILIQDMQDPDSTHDFGKDIIPMLVKEQKAVYAYPFHGYWKDVGTIDSLWEANMDLLYHKDKLQLDDPAWKIYTEDLAKTPHYISTTASIQNAYVNQGCHIEGHVENSVLFTGVHIHPQAQVHDAVLMPDVVVGEGAILHRCVVAEGVRIEANAVVGDPDCSSITLIAKGGKV